MSDATSILRTLVSAAFSGIAVFVFFKMVRARKPERDEKCAECGYDLRASPGQCPECGKPVPEDDALDLFAMRKHWPSQEVAMRPPTPTEVPVVVHRTKSFSEAHLLRRQLEARGVQCEVGAINTPSGDVFGSVNATYEVTVWSADEGLARTYVEACRESNKAARRRRSERLVNADHMT